MDNQFIMKTDSARRLSLGKRDIFAITANDRVKLKELLDITETINEVKEELASNDLLNELTIFILVAALRFVFEEVTAIMCVETTNWQPTKRSRLEAKKISSYDYLMSNNSESSREKF